MTTIAYKDGVMAADRMGTCGDKKLHGFSKIKRSRNYLIGFAGNPAYFDEVFTWIISVEDKFLPWQFFAAPEIKTDVEDFTLLITDGRDNIWKMSDNMRPIRIPNPYYAIGSGEQYALGAMEHMATAYQAVLCASRWCPYTGSDIDEVSFK